MTLTELKKKIKNAFVCYFPFFLRNFGYHRCPPRRLYPVQNIHVPMSIYNIIVDEWGIYVSSYCVSDIIY
ncbi:hypothetical protein BpHYR1_007618 [Brachionus plicatilis]|uniref:Uncharacterized protein n=1 Tax=Brachionus plicatilis TaxID=10195 RepID=A0A3M7QSS6_BRAPC|nr:hypothetical protein BpHYR1_007618 [Brachionus plicatilis]